MKKTVVFDFDGVIHSYTSGWQGVDVIPDEPVKGIGDTIKDVRNAGYEVVVVSTRCHKVAGIEAIYCWLENHNIEVDYVMANKPPALVYIDDRAICFDGESSSLLDKIERFKPWYDKETK